MPTSVSLTRSVTIGRMTVRAGILNVTGYAGAELARLLYAHPQVELAAVTGRSAAGKRLAEVFPHLWRADQPVLESLPDGLDVVFSALPHAAAAEQLAPIIRAGTPVVDLSADFRLKDIALYEKTYATTHPAPELVPSAVFGLPELHRDEIARTRLVATPGCHSTGVILALAPLVAAGVIEPGVIADTKTGLSGAGRALGLNVHFSEADESVAPYGLSGHRHLPEMVQELEFVRGSRGGPGASGPQANATHRGNTGEILRFAQNDPNNEDCLRLTFVPHYIPMTRGILSTCYATPRAGAGLDRARLTEIFREFYDGAAFTRVVDVPPATKHVAGTNDCLIHPILDERTGRVIVASALDNLGKGAAGAAVQCMNIMLGLPETAGLDAVGLFP